MKKKQLLSAFAAMVLFSSNSMAFSLPSNVSLTENKNFAPNLRINICKSFNRQVDIINQYITDNNLSDNLISKNLCKYITLSQGQIVNNDLRFQYGIYDHINEWLGSFTDYVDVTRKLELIILSTENVTQYLFYTEGDAVLDRQVKEGSFIYTVGGTQKGASYNAHGAGLLAGVFNRTAVVLSVYDVTQQLSPMNEFLCQHGFGVGLCVPGGSDNSPYWELDTYFPETSNTNTELSLTESTSFGFDIGASASVDKKGPTAGVSVGFSVSNSSSVSRSHTMLGVSTTKLANDLGIIAQWNISPTAVASLSSFGHFKYPTSEAVSDQQLGSSTWRDLDISANAMWSEIHNHQNCADDKSTRRMAFQNIALIERGAYDLEGSGSSARWDLSSDSVFQSRLLKDRIVVNTECQLDSQGNYYRVFKPGRIN